MASRDDPVAKQAVDWLALVRSGNATQEELANFAAWRRLNPSHDIACSRLEAMLDGLSAARLDGSAAREALGHKRRTLKGLLGLGALAVGGGVLWQRFPNFDAPEAHVALDSAIGERRELALSEDARGVFNANTSAHLEGSRLALTRGEVFVSCASGAAFAVKTPVCEVQAKGGQFAVRHSNSRTKVALKAGVAQAMLQDGRLWKPKPGDVASITAGGVSLYADRRADDEIAWLDGRLNVKNRPLSEVVDSLQDYTRAQITLDPRVAARRVSGTFSLDDPVKAVRSIALVLELQIQSSPSGDLRLSSRANGSHRSAA